MEGLVPEGEIEDLKINFQKFLSEEFENSKSYKPNKADWLDGKWSGLGKYTKEAVIKDGQYQRGKTSISIQKFNEATVRKYQKQSKLWRALAIFRWASITGANQKPPPVPGIAPSIQQKIDAFITKYGYI